MTVVNVWFTDRLPAPWAYFLKLQTLHLFRGEGVLRASEVFEFFQNVYGHSEVLRNKLSVAMPGVLREGINARLLETPEFLHIEPSEQLRGALELSLSDIGKYYAEEMAYLMEYVSYAKDACGYVQEHPGIEPATEAALFPQRFSNVVRFIRYLFGQEEALVREVKATKAWRSFRESLVPEHYGRPHLHVYMLMVEHVNLLRRHRELIDGGDIYRLNNLKERIEEVDKELFGT